MIRRWLERHRAQRDPIELTQGRRGTHLMPIVELPPGFVPPAAALKPREERHVMAGELPENILGRGRQVASLHRARPTAEIVEVTHLMIEMLHIAIHGDTWARPESPAEVWLSLLAEVSRMSTANSPKRQ